MFEINSYYSFISAILLFQLIPGAGTIAILTATASNGIKSGMSAVYGTLLGDFIYMSLAVLGLAAILQKIPAALTMAQYIGVFYLLYLGMNKLIQRVGTTASSGLKTTNLNTFKLALAICLTNPKAIMFFMAFFPLFLSQDSKPTTLMVMMMHVTIISLMYQTLLVIIADSASKVLSKWKYSKIIATRIAGLALIGFGVKLAKNIK